MYIGDVEITLREAIFSVTIASILFVIGFLISSKIEHSVNQRNLEYRQAAQIVNNTNEFQQAVATDIGNAFVEGDFNTIDTVSHENLKGEWAWIYADYQKYTKHTRTVTYTVTDSEGRSHTRTRLETYWTWDTYKTQKKHSKRVSFSGVEFPFEKFSYSYCETYKVVDIGFHKRIEYILVPQRFHASIYSKLENDTVSNNTTLFKDETVENLYKYFTTSHAFEIFWTLWSFLMIASVIGFVIIDNKWIEDDENKKKLKNNTKKTTYYGYNRYGYRGN